MRAGQDSPFLRPPDPFSPAPQPMPDILQFNQPFNAPLLCANCLQMQQQLCNYLWPANEKGDLHAGPRKHKWQDKKKTKMEIQIDVA